jgi:hypothetical protein
MFVNSDDEATDCFYIGCVIAYTSCFEGASRNEDMIFYKLMEGRETVK